MKSLLPAVVRFLTNSDIVTRKLACWIVQNCSTDDTDSLLLAVNILVKDSADSNPLVRSLCIKTLCTMRQEFIAEYAGPVLLRTLSDSSAHVRRIASLSCGKIFFSMPLTDEVNDEIVDRLYSMIRDEDPIVVVNSMCALNRLLCKEGGIVISRNIAHYLLGHLEMFDSLSLMHVLGFIRRYRPLNDDEVIDIMNMCDVYLKHNHAAVVACMLDYFVYLTQEMPHLSAEVFTRAKDGFASGLSSGNYELCFQLLVLIEQLLQDKQVPIEPDANLPVSLFSVKHTDPDWLTAKKLSVLSRITSERYIEAVYQELVNCVASSQITVAKESVNAITTLISRFGDASISSKCVATLVSKLAQSTSSATEMILHTLCNLDLTKLQVVEPVMLWIRSADMEHLTDNSQASVINLLGLYGGSLDEAPYILESCIEGLERKSEVYVLALVMALMRLFYVRAPECQDSLSRLLELCGQREETNIRETACLMYGLLAGGILMSRELVCVSTMVPNCGD
jgi:AP-4 complex subunit beta-1